MTIYWDYLLADDVSEILIYLSGLNYHEFSEYNDAVKAATDRFIELVADDKKSAEDNDVVYFSYSYDPDTNQHMVHEIIRDVIEYDDTDDYNEHSTFTKIGTGVR